ncbi:MAG: hypothetical protein HWE22_09325 [Flavobacteriales bacterium]|nr:hypothetical protein [Flavobacteriales bacterium]
MKLSIFAFFLAFNCFVNISLSQEADSSEIAISFPSSKSKALNKSIDSIGSERYTITFEITIKPDTVATKDYLIELDFKHFTTGDTSLRIVTPLFRLTKEALNSKRKISIDTEIEVFNNLSEISQFGVLMIRCDQVAFDEANHQKIITLIAKKDNPDESKATQNLIELQKESISASDTVDAAIIELMVENSKYYDGNIPHKFDVAKVSLKIEDGRFQEIIVYAQNLVGRFATRYPISATQFHSKRNEKIHYQGSDKKLIGTYIKVGELIQYAEQAGRRQFLPNSMVTLTKNKPIDTLFFYRNPISFFDARVYTDPIGLNGNSNGLLLTEVNSRFILNSYNHGRFTWFPFIQLHLGLTKYDSKFDTLSVASLLDRSPNTLLSLRQQANINFQIRLDVLRYSGLHESVFGIGHHIALTKVKDKTNTSGRSITPSFSVYWRGQLFSNPWISLDLVFPIYANYNHDNIFEKYTSKWDLMIAPELEVSIEPAKFKVKDEDAKNYTRIFARVRYYDMPNHRGNNFLQFHLGFSVPVIDLFKKK